MATVILKDGSPAKVIEDHGQTLLVEYERLDWSAGWQTVRTEVPRKLTKPLTS